MSEPNGVEKQTDKQMERSSNNTVSDKMLQELGDYNKTYKGACKIDLSQSNQVIDQWNVLISSITAAQNYDKQRLTPPSKLRVESLQQNCAQANSATVNDDAILALDQNPGTSEISQEIDTAHSQLHDSHAICEMLKTNAETEGEKAYKLDIALEVAALYPKDSAVNQSASKIILDC